jgi:hypothetical protein
MPKRTVALYDDQKNSSDEDTDNDDLDLQDFLTVPDCSDIIKNQHYFDFEENMGHKLTYIYRKHAYLFSNKSYINDKKMLCDDQFLMFIYKHIFKNYNNDFVKDNEMLKNVFYNNLPYDEITKTQESKKIIAKSNSKKFDWATKSYK